MRPKIRKLVLARRYLAAPSSRLTSRKKPLQ
jgi:hypothetical protein